MSTNMTMRLSSDGLETKASVMAHEAGHYYWTGTSKIWLREGPSELITFVSEHDRAGKPLETHLSRPCTEVSTLAELEVINPRGTDYGSRCSYWLGGRLFLDLYNTLGENDFLQGFRSLYLKRLHEDPTDDCEGTDLTICHVAAAFKEGISDDLAAKVDEIIARWYGPLP